jgi:hypothetical protein
MFDRNAPPSFPNDIQVIAEIQPSESLGVGTRPSRTGVAFARPTWVFDLYSGNVGIISDPPLPPIGFTALFQDVKISIEGNLIKLITRVEKMEDIPTCISTVENYVPPLLNLEIIDCPYITRITGFIGDVPFQWAFHVTMPDMTGVEYSDYTEKLLNKLQNLLIFEGGERNVRLSAALHYFYIACRLFRVGNTIWEFMPEIILNLAKVLDSLFVSSGNSRDDIRRGLTSFGASQEIIDSDFMPIVILRNQFGVAHISTATYSSEQLQTIYKYLQFVESKFRTFLLNMIKRVEEGSFSLEEMDTKPSREKTAQINRLIESMEKRLVALPFEK